MRSRRALLASLACGLGTGVAGCVADDPRSSPTADTPTTSAPPTTESDTETSTPACSEPRRPSVPVAGERDRVEPREYPEHPPELTVDRVRGYVRTFERAWLVNHAVREYDLVDFQFVNWGVSAVAAVDAGVTATVGGHVAPFWYRGTDTASTPMHYDRQYTAAYLVTDRRVLRAARTGSTRPDPRNGDLVVCAPR